MSDLKSIRISGELFYPRDLTVPNTTFNEDETRMQCTVGKLSQKAVEALEGMGVRVKNKEDVKENFIVSKSNYVFEPVDSEGVKVDPTGIGKGTKVQAVVSAFDHKMSKKFGKGVRIHKLIVTELVPYSPSMSDGEDEEAL